MKYFLSLALIAVQLVCSRPAGAQEPPGPRAKNETKPAPEAPMVQTEHTITLGGKAMSYKATAGYLVLKEEQEKGEGKGGEKEGPPPAAGKDALKSKAKIFFVAYTRQGLEAAKRPLTFAFNGGPGAASVWLHLGALGPRRVQLAELGRGTPPPYQLVDNELTWLEDSDLVFIDPVSTGYSRPAVGEPARAFHGFNEDLQSVAEFIRLYVTQNERWLSPKFLVGESYGGTRAAALAGMLQDRHDLYLNGLVIVSGVLNWQTIDFRPGNDLPYALYLPAYTAAAHFHGKLAPDLQQRSADSVRADAENFAMGDYLKALASGSALSAEERRSVARTIARFTGLSEELILRYRLRMPADQFMDELLKRQNQSVGRFDSRLTGFMSDPEGSNYDPSFTTMRGNFTAAINSYLRTELRFESELPYRSLASVGPWNFGNAENRYLDVADGLTRAMTKNPHLRAWILTGTYDLAVSYFGTAYTVRQMVLAPELQRNLKLTNYASGHMLYTDPAFLKPLQDGFRTFVGEAISK